VAARRGFRVSTDSEGAGGRDAPLPRAAPAARTREAMKAIRALIAVFALCVVPAALSRAQVPAPATPPRAMRTPPLREPAPVPAHIIIRDVTFQSASLGREMTYRVILPANYETSAKRYPVLYLLHGLFGRYTDWESLTHLDDY